MFPFHFATQFAGTPPAVVKTPPAYKLPLKSNAKAWISPLFVPEPKADHLFPFHFATRLAGTPPAVVNSPPAYKLPLKSNAKAKTP